MSILSPRSMAKAAVIATAISMLGANVGFAAKNQSATVITGAFNLVTSSSTTTATKNTGIFQVGGPFSNQSATAGGSVNATSVSVVSGSATNTTVVSQN